MNGLHRRLLQSVGETRLLPARTHVCVALSGGCDSVVLLRLLLDTAARHELCVSAAHLDHRMRPGSGADCDWVAGLCRAWGVPLVAAAAREPLRSEADARRARYAFLEAAARSLGADVVATAHHADDQAETILLRLARGTGPPGLRGIAPVRGGIVRPLLGVWRHEIEAFARGRGLAWRTDPSNRDESFLRNRVRHGLLPALDRIARTNGAGERAPATLLARLAGDARRVEHAWAAETRAMERACVSAAGPGWFEIARPALLGYPAAARARLLRALLRHLGSVPDRAGTEAVLAFISTGSSGGGIDVAGGIRAQRRFDRIRIMRARRKLPQPTAGGVRDLLTIRGRSGRDRVRLGGRVYDVEWSQQGTGQPRRSFGPTGDAPAVDHAPARVATGGAARGGTGELSVVLPVTRADSFVVRGWRAGDRIRFDYGSKKLKKLFNEKRVERPERQRIPLLAHADGRVLWVAGLASAVGTATGSHQNRLCIRVRHADEG